MACSAESVQVPLGWPRVGAFSWEQTQVGLCIRWHLVSASLPIVTDNWHLRSLVGGIGVELLVRVLRQLHLFYFLKLMSARRPLLVGGGGSLTSVRPPGMQLV